MLTDAPAYDETTVRSFDLTRAAWLPVQLRDGRLAELSLIEVFERAGDIRRLVGDLPTQNFALLRLLLAICHDALDGPADIDAWADLWENPDPFADVPDYLAHHAGRFDLLSPTAPFYQTPGLRNAKGEVSSLNRVVADVPNGIPLFTSRFPGVDSISFAEAARWVVHVHAFDISGIKTGVVGDTRVKGGKAYALGVAWSGNLGGVAIESDTLRETLLLNLIATDFPALQPPDGDDRPAWRRPIPTPGPQLIRSDDPQPHGLRDLYTWQSRRLLLHAADQSVHGVVLTYGDPLAPHNMHTHEPLTAWRRSTPQEKKLGKVPVYMPQEHSASRAAWRGLETLITRSTDVSGKAGEPPASLCPRVVSWIAHLSNRGMLPRNMLIRVHTYGMTYGTQQSLVEDVIEDELPLPVVLLNETDHELGRAAVQAVKDAEKAVDALGLLAADLAIAARYNDKRRVQGGEKDVAQIARDRARDRAYGELDHEFRLWLGGIRGGDEPSSLAAEWQSTVSRHLWRLGRELLDEAGDAAWSGRMVKDATGALVWRNAAVAARRFGFQLRKVLPLAFAASGASADVGGDGASEASTEDDRQEEQE